MSSLPWVVVPAALALLWGWTRLAFPFHEPVVSWMSGMASRVARGDLPDELSALDVFADDKLRMLEDVFDLVEGWNSSYFRMRRASIAVGTLAMIFGACAIGSALSQRFAIVLGVLAGAAFVALMAMLSVENRARNEVRSLLAGDISTLIQAWQARLSRTHGARTNSR